MTEHFLNARSSPLEVHTDSTPPEPGTGTTGRSAGLGVPAYAELARIVLGAQSLSAVLRRVAELARDLIPGADEVSVTLIEGRRPRTVGFAGNLVAILDERQYSCGRGPCLDAAMTGQTITIKDTALDTHYPEFSRQAHRHGIRHTLSVGIPTVGAATAALNICSRNTGPFSAEARDEATAFAGYAAVALANAALYAGVLQEVAQMKQALATRAVIEQAKGILIRDHSCSPDDAFHILRDTSSRTNHKLRDVAAAIVASAYTASTSAA